MPFPSNVGLSLLLIVLPSIAIFMAASCPSFIYFFYWYWTCADVQNQEQKYVWWISWTGEWTLLWSDVIMVSENQWTSFIRKDYDRNGGNIKIIVPACATISCMSWWHIVWKYGNGLVCMVWRWDIEMFVSHWCSSEGEGHATGLKITSEVQKSSSMQGSHFSW